MPVVKIMKMAPSTFGRTSSGRERRSREWRTEQAKIFLMERIQMCLDAGQRSERVRVEKVERKEVVVDE